MGYGRGLVDTNVRDIASTPNSKQAGAYDKAYAECRSSRNVAEAGELSACGAGTDAEDHGGGRVRGEPQHGHIPGSVLRVDDRLLGERVSCSGTPVCGVVGVHQAAGARGGDSWCGGTGRCIGCSSGESIYKEPGQAAKICQLHNYKGLKHG
jgi:hypothetical protein